MRELYHWEPNTFSLAALIGLNEKALDYQSRYIDWTSFEQYAGEGPELNLEAEHNPEQEGPMLKDGDALISDSFLLLEYLDDAYPQNPLKPRNAHGDWQVQVWGRFLGEQAAPAVSSLGGHRYLAPALRRQGIDNSGAVLDRMPTPERKAAWSEAIDDSYPEERLADSERKARLLIERVEKALADGASWLVEDTYTVADIEAFALANALPKLLPQFANPTAAPKFMAWLERMRARPAVQKALATSRTGKPDEAFAPGPEHCRWG